MKICYYKMDVIDSTSDWAKRHTSEFSSDTLYVVSANSQTKGRGRWGRSWVSPAGKNLYVTLAFSTEVPTFCCCQLVGLVLQEILAQDGVVAELKWPNDLLVKGQKIAGILAERYERSTLIGIGLNVNMSQEELETIPQKATSMAVAAGTTFELDAVLYRFVSLFVQEYEKAKLSGFREVSKSWHEKVQWMISQPVSVQTSLGRLKGHVITLASDGTVVLKTENGQRLSLQSGDIQI